MTVVGEAGCGVVILIREAHSASLSEMLQSRSETRPAETVDGDLREVGIGSQILLTLGVRDMILMSNTQRAIIGLEGYGLSVVGHQTLDVKEI